MTTRQVFDAFWQKALSLPMSYTGADRGLRNIGALVLGALPVVETNAGITIREFYVDDVVVRGVCPPCSWFNVEVSQLDARGADFSAVAFSSVVVGNLIADESIRVSSTFPVPAKITLGNGDQMYGVDEVSSWLGKRGRDPAVAVSAGLASAALRKKPIYALLGRAARMRQYWLRADSDDLQASKIISDPDWPTLSRILAKHDFLREETRQASGRASKFFHIKHRESILAESPENEALRKLFDDLQKA